jgi:hypothetical protein
MLFYTCGANLQAMERWAALAQIESGNNDHAVGHAGEISRYQIRREVWSQYAASTANWKNPVDSLAVAQGVMYERCATFQKTFRRPPTDFEFYVLWNAPAQVKHPSRSVRERAERFCQLRTQRATL